VEHSLETLKSCPSCGHDTFKNTLKCKDYTYSKDSFSLLECSNCHLLFTNPRPSEQAIGKYYDNPEYVSHTDTKKGLLFLLYGAVKQFTLIQKRTSLEKSISEKTVLDYGAGSGDFSVELASNGWTVSAYEPDIKARNKIAEKDSSIHLPNSINDIETASKSAITLWHVLEHVHRLNETISEFHRILKHDGTLVIAVPNRTSFDADYYKSEWAAYDVPRHLYHFDPKTIETLMSARGFELKQIRPMWFDSYYVSLLSENNSGKPGIIKAVVSWLRAFIVGSLSNAKAISSTSRCSSITYVFQKAV